MTDSNSISWFDSGSHFSFSLSLTFTCIYMAEANNIITKLNNGHSMIITEQIFQFLVFSTFKYLFIYLYKSVIVTLYKLLYSLNN